MNGGMAKAVWWMQETLALASLRRGMPLSRHVPECTELQAAALLGATWMLWEPSQSYHLLPGALLHEELEHGWAVCSLNACLTDTFKPGHQVWLINRWHVHSRAEVMPALKQSSLPSPRAGLMQRPDLKSSNVELLSQQGEIPGM